MNIIKKWEAASNLPPGHIKLKKLKEAIKKEYEACSIITEKWRKRLKNKAPKFDATSALIWCNEICDDLGERPLRKIIEWSPDVSSESSAHYINREIHFKTKVYFYDLVHELAHHFGPHGHGKDFCEILEFLFQVIYTKLTGVKFKVATTI